MRPFLAGLIIFLGCILTTGGHLYSPDDEVLFRVAQSIAFRGGISIEPIEGGHATAQGRNGRYYAQYGIGQALLSAPLLWAGEGLGRYLGAGARTLVFSEPAAFFTRMEPREITQRFCASFFNAFVAAILGGVFCWFAYRITQSRKAAFVTTLLYGLATFALAHARTYFTEPLATLCVFWSLALLHTGLTDRSVKKMIAGGALAGFSVLVRVDSVVAWPALFLYVCWWLAGRLFGPKRTGDEVETSAEENSSPARRGDLLFALSYLVPMGCGALAILALNYYRFGSLFETGYGDQPEGVTFGTPLLVGIQGLLFSIGRGLIYFSPPLILALWAFGSLRKRERRLTLIVGMLILSVLCFHAKWINWSGAWCWGPRHIFMLHVFLALPIAAWLAEAPLKSARRVVVAVLFVIGAAVQVYGCSQDFIEFYHVMFRTPGDSLSSRVLYSEAELPWHQPYYEVLRRTPQGTLEPMPMVWLGAPVNDSLYVPQNSCWAGYAAMWRAGYQDFLWVRLLAQ